MSIKKDFFETPYLVGIILFLHFTVWMCVSTLVNVAPDMADHWVWSRELYLSYYEHPPMIAIAMKIITLVGGNNEIALETGSVLFSCLILYLAYLVGKTYFDKKTGVLYLLILAGTPYFSAGSLFLHIDQPYMVFWLVGLLVWRKYIQTDNKNWILLLGVVAGLGALSKYITILFYIGIFVWCLIRKDQRHLLVHYKLYLAGVISLTLFSPVLIWNYQNNWVSFRYQFSRGLTGAGIGENLFVFTLGHLGLFSLVFSLFFWVLLIRKKLLSTPVEADKSFLLTIGFVAFAFFTFTSMKGTIADPHWLNVAYFSFFPFLANYFLGRIEAGAGKGVRLTYLGSYLLTLTIVNLILLHGYFQIIPIKMEKDTTLEMLGWQKTGMQIDTLLKKHDLDSPDFVITREFQLGGSLSLFIPGQPLSFSVEKPERNQWSPLERVIKEKSVAVCPLHECEKFISRAEGRLGRKLEYLGSVQTSLGDREVRHFKLFRLKE